MVLFLRKLKHGIPFLIALALLIGLMPPVQVKAASIVASGTFGDSLTWSYSDDGLLIINGSGDMPDFTAVSFPWYSHKSSIKTVQIGSNVTSIGAYAFSSCLNLTSITWAGNSVTSIGNYAFQNCSNLTSIDLPSSLTHIGDGAFRYCYKLTRVDIPSLVVAIGTDAFYMGSDSKIISIILNGSSTIKTLPASDMVDSGSPYCIFVDPFLLDEYREAYPAYSYRFCEYQSDWTDNIVPVTDYMTISTSTSSATLSNYTISDAWYLASVSSLECSALPYNYLPDSTKWSSTLDPNDKIFSFGSLKDVTYMDLTVSCTYTATGTASYNGNRSLYVYFYDSAGTLISSKRYGYSAGTKLVSGTQTVSCTTESIEVPDNAAYWGCFMRVNGFSGLTVTKKRFDVDLNLTSALVVPPVMPSVSSTTLKSYEYDLNTSASALSVNASVTDAGVLSYQWYVNTSNSTTGGTAISGATSATYTPSTGSGGTKYYYCKVTNTLDGLSTVAYSDVASVTVIVPAETPTFSQNLSGAYTYTEFTTASPLSISASVTDGGILSYQWYVNSVNSMSGGTAISGAISSSYTPSTSTRGTKYYYCVVKNTLGSLTATAISNVAAVTVSEETFSVSGVWSFESDLSNCAEFELDIQGVSSDDSFSFDGIFFDRYSLVFELTNGNDLIAWTSESGWIQPSLQVVIFNNDPDAPATTYFGFCSAAYCLRDASGGIPYYTILNIAGTEYHFFDYLDYSYEYRSSPNVSVTISETGVRMLYGSVVKFWTYTGDDDFAGFSLPGYSDEAFPVGFSGILPGTTGADTMIEAVPAFVQSATIVIGDQSYVFPGTVSSTPEITMDVLDGGVRLYDGVTSYFYEHDTTVVGYKLSPAADTYIGIGESYIFAGSDTYSQMLYPIYSPDVEYYTRVNIYDSTGTKLLGSYDFTTLGAAPIVSMTVLGNGCKLVFGDTVYSWSAGSARFYGFSPAMYVAEPYYVPGNPYTLPGGEPVNLTIDLYVHDTENSGLPAFDFVEWLKVAVGGFLDFEIFPGLSLDEILYFILVVQLLLWFLKVII